MPPKIQAWTKLGSDSSIGQKEPSQVYPTPNMWLCSSVGNSTPTIIWKVWVQILFKPDFFAGFFSAIAWIAACEDRCLTWWNSLAQKKLILFLELKDCSSSKCWKFKVNSLQPNSSMHILHTALRTFPWLLTRRTCLTIKSFISWLWFPFVVWHYV